MIRPVIDLNMATTRKRGPGKSSKASLRFTYNNRVRARSTTNTLPLKKTHTQAPVHGRRISKRRSTFNARHHKEDRTRQDSAGNQGSWPQRSSLRRALLESVALQDAPGLLSTNPAAGSSSTSLGPAGLTPAISIPTDTGGQSGRAQDGVADDGKVVGSDGAGYRSLAQVQPIAPSFQPQRSSLRRAIRDSVTSQYAATRNSPSPGTKARSSLTSVPSTRSDPAPSALVRSGTQAAHTGSAANGNTSGLAISSSRSPPYSQPIVFKPNGQRGSLRRAILESLKTTQNGDTRMMSAADKSTSQVTNDKTSDSPSDVTAESESQPSDNKSRKRKLGGEGHGDHFAVELPLRGSLRQATSETRAELNYITSSDDEVGNSTLGDVKTVHIGDGDGGDEMLVNREEDDVLVDNSDSVTHDLEQGNYDSTYGTRSLRRSMRRAVRDSQPGSAQRVQSGGQVTRSVPGQIKTVASADKESLEDSMPIDSQDTDVDIEQDHYEPVHSMKPQRRSARRASLERRTAVEQNAKPDDEDMTPALDEPVRPETSESREDEILIDSNHSEMPTPDQYYDDFDHELRPQRRSTRQFTYGSRLMSKEKAESHGGRTCSPHKDAEMTSPETHDNRGEETPDGGQQNEILHFGQVAILGGPQALSISTAEPELPLHASPTTNLANSETTGLGDNKHQDVEVAANDDYWAAEILRTLSIFRDDPTPIPDQTTNPPPPPPGNKVATENNIGGDHEIRDVEHGASVRKRRSMSISNIVHPPTPSSRVDESTIDLDVPRTASSHDLKRPSPDDNESQQLGILDYEDNSTAKSASTCPVAIEGHSRAPESSTNKRFTRSVARLNQLSTDSQLNSSNSYGTRSNKTLGLEKSSMTISRPALSIPTDVSSSFSIASSSTLSGDSTMTLSLSQSFPSATASTPLTAPSTPATLASSSSEPSKDGRADDDEDDDYDPDTEYDEADQVSEVLTSGLGSSSRLTLSAPSVSSQPENSDLATRYRAEIQKLGTPETWTKSEKDGKDESTAAARKGWYHIRQIVNEVPGLYFVEWEGTDPRTGVHWPGSWVRFFFSFVLFYCCRGSCFTILTVDHRWVHIDTDFPLIGQNQRRLEGRHQGVGGEERRVVCWQCGGVVIEGGIR
ncbi:hypothetical protein F5Y18DRAFT_318228 [Xylariaceae sp. FL1019]|nr:hypothetical protein F5Y18DRAFT_318228 [Xylariaceae sp. FL1019]